MNAGPRRLTLAEEFARLDKIARILDYSVGIPGTRFHFGLDALVGLVPGFGDGMMALLALPIVYRGWKLGAATATLLHMLWNVALDLIIGTVPVAGDVFDAYWKANRRNVDLLRNDPNLARELAAEAAGRPFD